MSDQFEINQFGEVVQYNCGRLVYNSNREPTEWEIQLIDALEQAQARIDELEGALEPFAKAHQAMSEPNRIIDPYEHITLHDLRVANEALGEDTCKASTTL